MIKRATRALQNHILNKHQHRSNTSSSGNNNKWWWKYTKRILFAQVAFAGISYAAVQYVPHLYYQNEWDKTYQQNELVQNYLSPCVHYLEGTQRFMRTMNLFAQFQAEYSYHDAMCTVQSYFWPQEQPTLEKQRDANMQQLHGKYAPKILQVLLQNGGIYIKMGQFFANMRGYVPDVYCDTFACLMDKVPSIDYGQVERAFFEQFGKRIQDCFVEFDKQPIAAASLAQVHKAILKDTNETVAVKVQYPIVSRHVHGDVETMKWIGRMANRKLSKEAQEASEKDLELLIEELDFRREAQNLLRAKRDLQHRDDVVVPGLIGNLSGEHILTMQFMNGVKITNIDEIRKMGYSVHDCARIMTEVFSEQLFVHGFLHGDPHPGNMFIRPNPKDARKPQLVLLDHGLYSSFSDDFRIRYAKLWRSIVLNEKHGIKEYCDHYGILHPDLFVMMLTFTNTMDMSSSSSTLLDQERNMSKEEWNKLMDSMYDQEMAKKWENIAEKTPKELNIIMRNQYLMRSVNSELGQPVNRFAIMVEYANRIVAPKNQTMLQKMYWNVRLYMFSWFTAMAAWFMQWM